MASAWGKSWGLSWLNSWGTAVTPPQPDQHDGYGYWYKHWEKLHKKKPTLKEVIEAVQEHPEEALQAVPQAKKHFQEIDYSAIRNNAVMQEFIARQILVKIEIKRIEDEENDFIEMLLLS